MAKPAKTYEYIIQAHISEKDEPQLPSLASSIEAMKRLFRTSGVAELKFTARVEHYVGVVLVFSTDLPGSLKEKSSIEVNGESYTFNSWKGPQGDLLRPATTANIAALATSMKDAGNTSFKNKEHLEAIAYYTRAIALKEENLFYSNRSAAFLGLRQFEMARRDAVDCALIDPLWAKAYMRLARALSSLGRIRDASAAILKAEELNTVATERDAITSAIKEFALINTHLKRCVNCAKECHQKCAKCRKVRYCSRQCQSSHWSQHSATCSPSGKTR